MIQQGNDATTWPEAQRRNRARASAIPWQAIAEVLGILAIFTIYAAWPIPDVNESQYLVRAKHFWNPCWAGGDFFLSEPVGRPLADTHFIFYLVAGWPSRFLTLYQFAWIGRACAWLFLAWSWRQLSFAVIPRNWLAPLTAGLMVMFNEYFQMAGEWVVGGLEAKNFSYGFVFLGLSAMARGHWQRAAVAIGLASALHVLVGGWSAVALLASWMFNPIERPSAGQFIRAASTIMLLALPGIVSAAAIDWGTPSAMLSEAARIYVFDRLPHHLLPSKFPRDGCLRFLVLFLIWVFFAWYRPPTLAQRRLRTFVLLSVTLTAIGIVLAWISRPWPDLEAQLMRFYWFRLADVALPLGAALAWTAALAGDLQWDADLQRPQRGGPVLGFLAPGLIVCVFLIVRGQAVFAADRPRGDVITKVLDFQDWRSASEWAGAHTPGDAVFLTPRTSQTFKWYSGRGEVVNWKDVPQNALGTIEWWQRLVDIHGRDQRPPASWRYDWLAELSAARLRELGRKYHAQYVIAESEPVLDLPRLFANGHYAIYRLD